MIVESVRYHRNGVAGAGYFAVRLRVPDERGWRSLGAIVFDAAEHVAIMDDDGNSWRCEDFEADLRAFVESDAGQLMAFPTLARAANDC